MLRGHLLPATTGRTLKPTWPRRAPEATSSFSATCAFGFSARPPAEGFRSGTATARRARPRARACARGRGRSRRSRSAASDGPWFLVNASPDARQQLETLAPGHVDGVRAPPVAGVLLTDAEIDHTAGLLLLRESAAPVRVFGAAGVERALTRRLSGADDARALLRRRVADARAGRAIALDGSSLTVEPFATAATRRSTWTGRTWSSRRAGSSFRDRASGGVAHLRARARRGSTTTSLDRFAASDLVLVDGTFWRDDELAAARHLDRSARDMGHVPLSGPGGTLEALAGAGAAAQGARPHQQHEPDPARGLARARRGRPGGRRSRLRWTRGRAVTRRSSRRRAEPWTPEEFVARCGRRARATTTCTRSTGG